MTIPQAAQLIVDKISPQLFELGCENYVLLAVMTDGEGQRARVVIARPGSDPNLALQIMPIIRVADEWEKGNI